MKSGVKAVVDGDDSVFVPLYLLILSTPMHRQCQPGVCGLCVPVLVLGTEGKAQFPRVRKLGPIGEAKAARTPEHRT